MIGFNITSILLLSLFVSCVNQNNSNSTMEISNYIKYDKNLENLINKAYEAPNSFYTNPIYPFKVSYKNTSNQQLFCNIPIVASWIRVTGNNFTFFIIVKNNENILPFVIKKYGAPNFYSETEINRIDTNGKSYFWTSNHLNIIINKFYNLTKNEKFDNCSIIIFGNMNYNDLT